ncbi:MAG: electron transport complex subunit RsxC, partial [Bacteroidia bacterium]|nr:electron transport complex subunit RsxC [Bacteroidia bacterium]
MINFLQNKLTFQHGVHPVEYKDLSCQREIVRMPYAAEYSLPLNQHIGAPAQC